MIIFWMLLILFCNSLPWIHSNILHENVLWGTSRVLEDISSSIVALVAPEGIHLKTLNPEPWLSICNFVIYNKIWCYLWKLLSLGSTCEPFFDHKLILLLVTLFCQVHIIWIWGLPRRMTRSGYLNNVQLRWHTLKNGSQSFTPATSSHRSGFGPVVHLASSYWCYSTSWGAFSINIGAGCLM